jgi:hypothetical protein
MALLHAPGAGAQDMEDGEARVSSRSDVQMQVSSGPATNARRLGELAGVLGGALVPVRRCYAKVLGERPGVQGDLKLSVKVPERGKVQVAITSDTVKDAQVRRCTQAALQKLDYASAPRPSAAFVHYTYTHEAAEGMEATRGHKGRSGARVTRTDDGVPESIFHTPGGEVRFTVVGAKGDDDERVLAAHAGMRKAVPGLLDCRRRAAKRDQSPEGELHLTALVTRTGRAQSRVVRSTVKNPIASRCVAATVNRTTFDRAAMGRWTLQVRFSAY